MRFPLALSSSISRVSSLRSPCARASLQFCCHLLHRPPLFLACAAGSVPGSRIGARARRAACRQSEPPSLPSSRRRALTLPSPSPRVRRERARESERAREGLRGARTRGTVRRGAARCKNERGTAVRRENERGTARGARTRGTAARCKNERDCAARESVLALSMRPRECEKAITRRVCDAHSCPDRAELSSAGPPMTVCLSRGDLPALFDRIASP